MRGCAILAVGAALAGVVASGPAVAFDDGSALPPRDRLSPGFDPIAPLAGAPPREGRRAVFATIADMAEQLYADAKVKLGLDKPGTVPRTARPVTDSLSAVTFGVLSVQDLKLSADPTSYERKGLAAQATVSTLGLDTALALQLGTEQMRQTLRVEGDCDRIWLPNEVAGSLSHSGDSPWTGQVKTAWGTACTANASGWRIIAGLHDQGTDTVGSLGLEYRPGRFHLLTTLAGITAIRADVQEDAGSVGAELDMGDLHGTPIRLDAGLGWRPDGTETLRIGTRISF